MTDGVTGVLARIQQLDTQIRAVDPSWSGVSGEASGAAGSTGWAASTSFNAAFAAAGTRAASTATESATAPPTSDATTTAGTADADTRAAGGPAGYGTGSVSGGGASPAAPSAGAPAWAIPASALHARPIVATGNRATSSAAAFAATNRPLPSNAAVSAGKGIGGGPVDVSVTPRAYVPPLVTERFGRPPYTNCSWAAVVMLMAKASAGTLPTTSNEVLALRDASGDLQGGSTSTQNRLGVENRYGFALTRVTSKSDALDKLASGWGAKLNLTSSALPSHLRRWDPDFVDGHSVYVQDYDPVDGTVLWLDPLAPAGHPGERVKVADVTGAVWWDDVVAARQGSFRH